MAEEDVIDWVSGGVTTAHASSPAVGVTRAGRGRAGAGVYSCSQHLWSEFESIWVKKTQKDKKSGGLFLSYVSL